MYATASSILTVFVSPTVRTVPQMCTSVHTMVRHFGFDCNQTMALFVYNVWMAIQDQQKGLEVLSGACHI